MYLKIDRISITTSSPYLYNLANDAKPMKVFYKWIVHKASLLDEWSERGFIPFSFHLSLRISNLQTASRCMEFSSVWADH